MKERPLLLTLIENENIKVQKVIHAKRLSVTFLIRDSDILAKRLKRNCILTVVY